MSSVSIIIPIYNQEKYLEKCLESAMEQDITDYEILLVDDGSTDGSQAICERFIAQNKLFRYFYQENAGLGPARNTGIFHAKGDYLVFLDSDDALEKNSLGSAIRYMEANALDMLYIDAYICDESLRKERVQPIFPKVTTRIERIDALELSTTSAYIWAKIYRKELFSGIEFPNIWYEDIACFTRLVNAAERIGYYKVPLYLYRQSAGSITHQYADTRTLDVIKSWEFLNRLVLSGEDEKSAVKKALSKSVGSFLIRSGAWHGAEYLEWYQHNLEGKLPRPLRQEEEAASWTDDYSLMQQALFFKLQSAVELLRALRRLYENGGEYFLAPVHEIGTELEEALFLRKVETLEICGIRAKAKDPVLWEINKRIRGENIISLKGNIKDYLLKNLLVDVFIQSGYPVRLIESENT